MTILLADPAEPVSFWQCIKIGTMCMTSTLTTCILQTTVQYKPYVTPRYVIAETHANPAASKQANP